MAARVVDVVLDVVERDLAGTGAEHIQGDQLGGLDDAHDKTVDPPRVKIGRRRMSKKTVVRQWLDNLEKAPRD